MEGYMVAFSISDLTTGISHLSSARILRKHEISKFHGYVPLPRIASYIYTVEARFSGPNGGLALPVNAEIRYSEKTPVLRIFRSIYRNLAGKPEVRYKNYGLSV